MGGDWFYPMEDSDYPLRTALTLLSRSPTSSLEIAPLPDASEARFDPSLVWVIG